MQMKNTAKRFATAALLAGFVGSASAATVVYNDSTGEYTAYADGPFAATFGALSQLDGVGTPAEPDASIYDFRGLTSTVTADSTYLFLEDFQDGQLDTPGLTGPAINTQDYVRTRDGRNGSTSKSSVDNVAEDTFPTPSGGAAFRFGNTATKTWTFNSAALGGNLPTYFGFAFPESFGDDALNFADLVIAYDIDDNVIGTIDNTGGVTPSAVPFYGFQTDVGIAYVEITMNSAGEIDHFQYGRLVGAEVKLDSESIVSNAAPGSLVGNLYMSGTNGTFTYSMDSGGDNDYFQILSATTNLRTAAWIDSDSYSISIIGTEQGGGGLVVTNDFTITVDAVAADEMSFVVSADVQSGAGDGTLVGTAQADRSGASFSMIGGRTDLFYMEGADLKLTNAADWGGIGTTNYVTLQASGGAATNELVIAASVVSTATSGTLFKFR